MSDIAKKAIKKYEDQYATNSSPIIKIMLGTECKQALEQSIFYP